ncbi:Fc.00g048390.m01.CDS01 [Cosmosporella sp. VM-42]
MDYKEIQRTYTGDQRPPPLSRKGRPPHPTEYPRNAHSERNYRSNSGSSRAGSRSRSHQGRDSDTMSMKSKIDESKSPKSPWQVVRRAVISVKASGKQHFSMGSGSQDQDVNKSPANPKSPISKLNTLAQRNSSGSQEHVSGRFDPSIPTVQQNSVTVSQMTATGIGIVNYEQSHVTQRVVNQPVQKTVVQVNESALYSPETAQPDKSKDLPPDPPLYESHASEAPGLHSTANEHFKKLIDDQKKHNDDLCRKLDDQHNEYQLKVQELNQEIAKWRARVIDAASKSADVPIQMPLSRPESELLKDWQNLAFDVRNLVANHFGSTKESKVTSWANARVDWLREVTPNPVEVASDRRSGSALIEAAIWNALIKLVLGEVNASGPMCWAGKYKRRLYMLSKSSHLSLPSFIDLAVSVPDPAIATRLQRDLAKAEPEQYTALYTQWRALTVNIIHTVQLPQDRDEEVDSVVEELEELLPPCRPSVNSSGQFRRELQAVVAKAIGLDLKFSGQQASYTVGWPGQARCNVDLDRNLMKVATGSPKKTLRVRFMIQPCLFRAGGRGESFETIPIDYCSVWMA